jgi:hypothetical protein
MRNKIFNHILVSLLFLACSYQNTAAQNIQADAKLEQSTIRIGDQTFLKLSVHQPAKAIVNFPHLADTLVSKVQIVKAGKQDTVADKNDPQSITVSREYTITGFDAGTYTVPSFSFGTSTGVIKTNELTLQVATVKVDTTKGIYDIKQPLAVTYTFWDWLRDNWYWIALIAVGIVAVIGLFWYLKKRPVKEKAVPQIVAPDISAHDAALNKLKELKEKKLWQQGDVKLYYIELTDILRDYLEKRYEIKSHEKTTDEIFEGLKRRNITSGSKSILLQVLTVADLVKFAKEKPIPAENESSMDNAVIFVLQTKQDNILVNEAAGGGHV